MRVIGLHAENVKGLKCVSITPTGNMIYITGKNASGKTSVLDCILWALCGTKNIQGKPIRKGQDKAKIQLDLGDKPSQIEMEVVRNFSGEASTLILTGDGKKYPSPQSVLDGITGSSIAFDPLAFSRMDAKQQFEQLRLLVNLKIDPKEMDAKNEFDYEERRKLNAQYKTMSAKISAFPQFPEDLPEKEIDVSEVSQQLTAASAQNASIEVTRQRRTDAIARAERNKGLALKKQEDIRAALVQAEADEKRFAEEIEKLQKEKDEKGVDISSLQEKIGKASEINRLIVAKRQRDELCEEAKHLTLKSDELTEGMKQRTDDKLAALASAKMPVKGLAFGDGNVLFNGVPLEQASTAERIKVGCGLVMKGDKKLRVMRIEDGSLIDASNLKVIEEMANEHDWQVWIEMVQSSEKTAIIMEDGNIVKVAQ